MKIEDIPSDELVVMSDFWHRAFNSSDCDPMCHCCEKMIATGDEFKLATVIPLKGPVYNGHSFHAQDKLKKEGKLDYSSTVAPVWDESKEVMLCSKCTAEDFKNKEMKFYNSEVDRIKKPKGGCFRIGGKIIH